MEAEKYFLTSLTAGAISQTEASTKSLSLTDVLDGLCSCALFALELAAHPQTSGFANIIYCRACEMARGLGYRLSANVAEGDRRELLDKINAASSPAQLVGYADTADKLLEGKQTALKRSYQQGIQAQPNFGGGASGQANRPPLASFER